MAGSYNARCIVLQKTKLKETDAIVTMLSSQGHQIRAVAKGLRRPGSKFGARLEPFCEVDLLLYEGRNLDIVREVQTVNTNAFVREDLVKTASCDCTAELLVKTTRDADVEERIYFMAATAFLVTDKAGPESAGLLAAAALFKALSMMGLRPALCECALCGRPIDEPNAFDVGSGGVLCASCAGGFSTSDFDAKLIGWLAYIIGSTFADIATTENAPTRQLLALAGAWINEHLAFDLRSLRFLMTLV